MRVRKGMKVKLHAFLIVAWLDISRFCLYVGIWIATRIAFIGCVLGLDTAQK
jgi:hypothetical protein